MIKERSELKPVAKNSVVGLGELTHGTLEQVDLARAKRFMKKVLNLRVVRHVPPAQMIAGKNDAIIVSLGVNKAPNQEYTTRWILSVPDAEGVSKVRDRALAFREEFPVKQIGEVQESNGEHSLSIQDEDGNWWEIVNRPASHYENIFARGDC